MTDLDDRDESPMPDPWTAMSWPLRLIVVVLIFCAVGAAIFH